MPTMLLLSGAFSNQTTEIVTPSGPHLLLVVNPDPSPGFSAVVQGTNTPQQAASWSEVTRLEAPGQADATTQFARLRIIVTGTCSLGLSSRDAIESTGGGGGAMTIADGADAATGAKSDAAYTDATGAASASVVALLKGAFVKLAALVVGQSAQATSTLQAKMTPMRPPLGKLATVATSTTAAAAAVTAGSQLYLCAIGQSAGVVFKASSDASDVTNMTGTIAVPTVDSGGVVVEVPAGATHMIYISTAAGSLTYGGVSGA